MKKILFTLVLLFVLVSCCTGTSEESACTCDSTEAVDSVEVADTLVVEEVVETVDSVL